MLSVFQHLFNDYIIRIICNITKQLQEENITILLVEQNATAALKIADRA